MQLLFIFVEGDNEEVGEPVANYFGITGQETTVRPRCFWHHWLSLHVFVLPFGKFRLHASAGSCLHWE